MDRKNSEQARILKWSGVEAPRVSLLASVYNDRSRLEESIASVLNQDLPLELILIDGGSNDGSLERMRGLTDERFTILSYGKNPGRSVARNESVRFARAPWLCFFDPHVLFLPGALAGFIRSIENTRAVEWAYCGIEYADPADPGERGPFDILRMLSENMVPDDLFVVRYDVFVEMGGYPVTRKSGGDYALKLRLMERGDPFFYDRICARSRRPRMNKAGGSEGVRGEFRKCIVETASRPDVEERRKIIRSALFLKEAAKDRRWADVRRYGEYLASRDVSSFELDQLMTRALCEQGTLEPAWKITMQWISKIVEGRHVLPGEALWAVTSSLRLALMCKDFEKVSMLMPLAESVHQVIPDRNLKRYITRGKLLARGSV